MAIILCRHTVSIKHYHVLLSILLIRLVKTHAEADSCSQRKSSFKTEYDVILFDAYGTILDLNTLANSNAVTNATSDPTSFLNLWRMKQLNYTWLRSLMNKYQNFWKTTSDALDFTLDKFGLSVEYEERAQLMESWLHLSAYPDVTVALNKWKSKYQLAILSNGSPKMLQQVFRNNGLDSILNPIISVDPVKMFKPKPRVYLYGQKVLKRPMSRILFVSSNSWDAIGAQSFGFTSAWINRDRVPSEILGVCPDLEFSDFKQLTTYLNKNGKTYHN